MSLLPINTTSYAGFRADALARALLNQGYDVDGSFGYQCWDLAAELWMNTPEFSGSGLYPQTGPNMYAEECWTVSRTINAGTSFDLIYNITDLKRGDVIVLGPSPISETGHIAFCDEPYNGTTTMDLLGQNQVNPNPYTGHIPTVTTLSISAFLGAFRFKAWNTTPPTHLLEIKKGQRFPWVIYTRKLRKQR